MDIASVRQALLSGTSLFDIPLRVTFYARVSTDKLEQQRSIHNQREHYKELIEKTARWSYVEGYYDEGISGVSVSRRRGFLTMVEDARAGRFDYIITKEISRFSRSTLDSILYTQKLLSYGVAVLFQNDNINTIDPDSEFRLTIMAGVAQDEVRKMSERLHFGFARSIKQGRVLGNSSITGYQKKDCVLSIDPEQAEVVRLVFTLYADAQMGMRSISRYLFERGVQSAGGKPLSTALIRNMIKNPKYKGFYCGNRYRSDGYKTRCSIPLPESQWVQFKAEQVPAIVSEEQWERANRLLLERGGKGERPPAPKRYPYSKKLFCQSCQKPLHHKKRKGAGDDGAYWVCGTSSELGKAHCKGVSIREGALNGALTPLFSRVVDRGRVRQALKEALMTALSAQNDALFEQARIKAVRKKKGALLELYADGHLGGGEFEARNAELNAELESVQQTLREQEGRKRELEGRLERCMAFIDRQLEPDCPQSAALLACIVERITLTREGKGVRLHIALTCGVREEVVA